MSGVQMSNCTYIQRSVDTSLQVARSTAVDNVVSACCCRFQAAKVADGDDDDDVG